MSQLAAKSPWPRPRRVPVPLVVLGGILALGTAVVLIGALVFGLMRSSDAYKEAVARARAHPAVLDALGSPIEEGYFTTGKIHVSGQSGRADLAIPISGPNGKGTLYVVASKSGGQWSFHRLHVKLAATGQSLDLLPR